MRAYSMDLRERVVSSLKSGMSKSAVASLFRIDRSTVHSYSKLSKEGNLEAKSSPGRPRKLSVAQEQQLVDYIKMNNDLSLEEYAAWLASEHGVNIALSTVHLYCRRAGITRKSSLEQEVLSRY